MKFDTHTNDNNTDANKQTQSSSDHRENPVLNFVLNVSETAKYIWIQYLEWIIDVSWGKALLAGLLTLILGGMVCIHTFANLLVLGSLLLKCFIGKENNTEAKPAEPLDRPEES